MAVTWTGDDRTAPRRGRNGVEDGPTRLCCSARNANVFAGEESRVGPLREDDRGGADLGRTCPIEPAGGSTGYRTGKVLSWPRPSPTALGRPTLPATGHLLSPRQNVMTGRARSLPKESLPPSLDGIGTRSVTPPPACRRSSPAAGDHADRSRRAVRARQPPRAGRAPLRLVPQTRAGPAERGWRTPHRARPGRSRFCRPCARF